MKEQQIIRGAIFLFAILIFALSFVTGKSINDYLFRWLSGLISLIIIIWEIYDKYLWRKWILKKITQVLGIPVLFGTWRGKLKFESDESGKDGETEFYVSINQTLTAIVVRSFFNKPSEARSITAKIEQIEPDRKELVYIYRSSAPYGKRDKNRPHDGACILNIVGNPVKKLSGSYFTDRKGAGTILLDKHSDMLAENFDDASSLEYK